MNDTSANVKIGFNSHVSDLIDGLTQDDLNAQFVTDYFTAAATLAHALGVELFSQLQIVQEANRYLERSNLPEGLEFV